MNRQTFGPRLATALLLAAALAIGGCVQGELQSEYRNDGSARHSLETTIDRDAVEQLQALAGDEAGQLDILTASEEAEERAEAAGLDFEPVSTDDRVGSRVSKEFEDGEDIGAAFDEIFTASTDEGADVPLGAVTGTFVQDGDDYRLTMTIDSGLLFTGFGEGDEIQGFSPEDLVEFSYTATMPGDIQETNGEEVDDDTARWEIPVSGVTEISAVSSGSSGSDSASLLIIVGLILLLLIGAAVAVFLFTRRRPPAPAPAVATPAGPVAPVATTEAPTLPGDRPVSDAPYVPPPPPAATPASEAAGRDITATPDDAAGAPDPHDEDTRQLPPRPRPTE
jgi:hypothetical protein